jgi:hypothetical protein
MVPGIKNGEILRVPPSSYISLVASIEAKPPIPEPMDTPIRSPFSSVTSIPESLNASIPAIKPK